ncbi:MAG: CorA family divalent cation transporter, partial [Flavitalea sp.]
MNEVVNCAAYLDGRRVGSVEVDDIKETLQHSNKFLWVGLHEPEEETLQQFQRELCLHDLAIEDAHNAHQRPKIETYGDTLFVVLRTAQINKVSNSIEFG